MRKKSGFVTWSDEYLSARFTGFIRVSSPKQVDIIFGGKSLEAQHEEIIAFKRKYNLDFDDPSRSCYLRFSSVFSTIESGKFWGPVAMKAMNHVQLESRILVCCGLDRFSRQKLTVIESKLNELGIELLVLDLGRVVDPIEIWSGAHSTKNAERSRATKRSLIYKSKHDIGKPPGRPRVIDEETSSMIKKLRVEGMTIRKIMDVLNQDRCQSRPLTKSTVSREVTRIKLSQKG